MKNTINILFKLFLLSYIAFGMHQDIIKGEIIFAFFLWFPLLVFHTLFLIKDFFNLK